MTEEPAQETIDLESNKSPAEEVAVGPVVAAPRLDAFLSIPVTLELVLASLKMPVSSLMDFQVGTEINLDHQAGAEVSLVVNGSKIAFGHLFLIDPKLRTVGVRISRLAAPGEGT
ncbi:MAG: FliM/FliN family flagellar motor switch protein [Notoacmeibacter sp.]